MFVIVGIAGQKFSFTKRFTPEIPAVVVCHGLSPATRYPLMDSRFYTLLKFSFTDDLLADTPSASPVTLTLISPTLRARFALCQATCHMFA